MTNARVNSITAQCIGGATIGFIVSGIIPRSWSPDWSIAIVFTGAIIGTVFGIRTSAKKARDEELRVARDRESFDESMRVLTGARVILESRTGLQEGDLLDLVRAEVLRSDDVLLRVQDALQAPGTDTERVNAALSALGVLRTAQP